MTISLSEVARRIKPKNTVILFGAGASVPSGAPSVSSLISHLSGRFSVSGSDYSLSEIASIVEESYSRRELIESIREKFNKVRVTGSLMNLPLYGWKSLYTTNYDTLVEQAYQARQTEISVVTSNFDFGIQRTPEKTRLYKIHGSIEKDEIDGNRSRIVISENDYDLTFDYREMLFQSLQHDLNGSDLIIIGYSLSDSHIKDLINRALELNNKAYTGGAVTLIMYTQDENRAKLHEKRGVKVAFGSLDDFFLELHKQHTPERITYSSTGDPLDGLPNLRPVTIDIRHQANSEEKDASAIFNGWPASYADIRAGLTFPRSKLDDILRSMSGNNVCCLILGPSGIGKTTLSKQALCDPCLDVDYCWEHKREQTLIPSDWREVARLLRERHQKGILLIDDVHLHLREVNDLLDAISIDGTVSLKLIMTSTRNMWNPRVKSAVFFKMGDTVTLGKLDSTEIDQLLRLIESNVELRNLVGTGFAGFSKLEQKRRLTVRCESDAFVCLKNIFASEKFDDIILREYADLESTHRDVYRIVAALESAGVNVHRQLIIRLLSIPAGSISATLEHLADIIHENLISEKYGIYGWQGRHSVIADIITKYKMNDEAEYFSLFEKVIECIIPSYDIEVKSLKQMCSFDLGVGRLSDKHRQNVLFRKMISKIPGERVPRHRLIRNLIDLTEFEKAETEIRIFEKDFGMDGPVSRYRIRLLLARVERTPGILDEDRIVILDQARKLAEVSIERFPENKDMLRTYCDVGLEYFIRTSDPTVFDRAIGKLREAESSIGDPDIPALVALYERRFSSREYNDGNDS
jgi:hypothetical protein